MTTQKRRRHGGDVVVLNASYELLGVADLKRAIVHIASERVDVVLADEQSRLHSANFDFELPLIVAFRDYINVPFSARRDTAPWDRKLMLRRDNFVCGYCGGFANTVDHINPRFHGGRDEWMNTIAACLRCNGKKGSKTLAEFGVPLLFQPRVVYREDTLLVAVEKLAERHHRREEFLELIPALAKAR